MVIVLNGGKWEYTTAIISLLNLNWEFNSAGLTLFSSLIIRLMNASEREKIKGHISGAMLFLVMAESIRRNLEIAYNKEYPEEDEQGFGTVFQDAKIYIQGSVRVLDGNRIIANQFLRRFGLDYGIRVNFYVEGDTEFQVLSSEFEDNSSVLIINLKGKFVERLGKGITFRESLRNDMKAKTFSMILLDGDVSDNLRVVRQAAKADEICGMFFVSTPDFEMQNFNLSELAKIVFQVARDEGVDTIQLEDIEKATSHVTTSKQFVQTIKGLSSHLSFISKGTRWGNALATFANNNPIGGEFGNENDRLINQIIKTAYHCSSISYEPTRREYKVDPETGQLIKRTNNQ